MDNSTAAHSAVATSNGGATQLQKPKSRLLMFRDRLLSPHLKEYRPHAAESLHQRQVSCLLAGRAGLSPSIDSLFRGRRYVFNRVINNSHHVLQSFLPAKRDIQYNLRTRIHDRVLIDKTTDLNECDFIIRMLYKVSY